MDRYIELTHDEMKARVIKDANDFYNGRTVHDNDLVYDEMLKLIKEDEPSFNIYDHVIYDTDAIVAPHTITFRDFTKDADIADYDEASFAELKKKYIVTPKFDGSSTVSYYLDGKLTKILSRGDDCTGFVNTNKLRNKVPTEIHKEIKAILAEAVVPIKLGGRAKANGLINSKYLQDDVDKCLTLIPFDYQYTDGTSFPNTAIECSIEQIVRIRDTSEYEYMGEIYPCDGIVCYPKERSNFIEIHKVYFTEKAETVLRDIDWSVSWNSGLFHPVAEFDTVELDGTEVSRATLNNYLNLVTVGYRVGSRLTVIKAKMTIPQILDGEDKGHDKNGDVIPLKVNCPYCKSELVQFKNDLACKNPWCQFWMYTIKYRISQMYFTGDNDIGEYLWQLPPEEFKYLKDLLPETWYEDIVDNITNLMWILSIPRVGEGKINSIAGNKGDRHFATLDESLEFIGNYLSDNQYDYMMMIAEPLKLVVNKLRE